MCISEYKYIVIEEFRKHRKNRTKGTYNPTTQRQPLLTYHFIKKKLEE